MEAVFKSIGKILNAYPLRLKRLLFLNVGSNANAPFVAQVSEFIKKFDQDVQVESIVNHDDLTRVISADERERKYGGGLPNACEFWPIHTTNKYEETESNMDRTVYESAIDNNELFE